MLKSILKQEKEFLKLNEEIELKTKNLMTQVHQIKEMHSDIDKPYSNWEKSDISTPSEYREHDREDEQKRGNQHEFNTSNISSEDNYILKDFTFTPGDEVSESLHFLGEESKETTDAEAIKTKKDKIRRNLKLSQSAKKSSSLMSTTNLGQESTISFGLTRHKSDLKLRQCGIENDLLPETLKGVGQEGIARFLTAKVKLLTEQVEIMKKDEKKHMEKIKELQTHKEKSLEERDKLIQHANVTKNVLVKYEQHTNNIVTQLQTTQAENGHLKKELESLKKELRQSNQNYSANELRLNRALGEIDNLKATLQQVKQEEKEFRENYRKKMEDLSNTIKKLDKQRMELLNGFKKQLLIIDNLKRQKGLMEAGKLLMGAEGDFINFLDCNPHNTVRRINLKTAKS